MDRHAVGRAVVTGELAPLLRLAPITPLAALDSPQTEDAGSHAGRQERNRGKAEREGNAGHLDEQRTV